LFSSCRGFPTLSAGKIARKRSSKPKRGAGSRPEQLCLLLKTILPVIGRKSTADSAKLPESLPAASRIPAHFTRDGPFSRENMQRKCHPFLPQFPTHHWRCKNAPAPTYSVFQKCALKGHGGVPSGSRANKAGTMNAEKLNQRRFVTTARL